MATPKKFSASQKFTAARAKSTTESRREGSLRQRRQGEPKRRDRIDGHHPRLTTNPMRKPPLSACPFASSTIQGCPRHGFTSPAHAQLAGRERAGWNLP